MRRFITYLAALSLVATVAVRAADKVQTVQELDKAMKKIGPAQQAVNKAIQAMAYADAKKQGAVLGYGQFLTVAFNFLIVAFVLFIVIRAMNRLKRQQDAKVDVPKAPEIPADVKLLSEIRDLLAKRPA